MTGYNEATGYNAAVGYNGSGASVDVTPPVAALTTAVPAPTVSAGSAISVAVPVLALSLSLLVPTVSAGSSVVVAPPVMAVTVAAPAPTVDITAIPPYPLAVLTDAPDGYYKLDETSGSTLIDSSGNARHGTWTGSPTRGVTGAVGNAYTTGAGGGEVADAAWNSYTSGFTLEALHKPNGSRTHIVEKFSTSGLNDGYALRLDGTTGKLVGYSLSSGSTASLTSPSAISTGVWHHYAFTHDGTNGRLYVDGTLVAGPTAMAAPSNGSSNLMIGRRGNDSLDSAGGDVDEVALYTGALSAARVLAHADALTAGSVTVTVPVAAVTVAVPAPTVTAGATVAVAVPVMALTTTAPAPDVDVSNEVAVAVPVAALTVAALAPGVTVSDYITVTIDAGVTIDPLSVEIGGATGVEDVVTVDLDAGVDLTPYVLLRPVAPTAGVINEWPIERQAHLMAALSAANPRYRGGIDYTIDRDLTGRLHVFVGGVDVTYKDGCPAFFEDWSSSVPFGPETARIAMPQMKPWDDPGSGDWAMFEEDAPVEIALVRPDDTVDHLWEGFLAVEGDTSGQSSEDYTFTADGLFAQAAHELHDPPIVMPARDYGHIIADVLNSVTHRRWSKIPRFTSGYTTLYRGEQGQTKWQYVQDLLARCFHADHRQLTIARVAPYTYRVQWKKAADAAADWTVTKGAPGVSVSLERNHSSRVDAIYGRGFAPDGGFWCGRVFPGLDAGVPPLYPMAGFANISVGTTDADTTTGNGVTTWQRQMREMGYPVTVDGVMNSADTYWVEKIQRASGSTVDGSLGPQTWAATWENNSTAGDFTSYRLPLATRTQVEPNLYAANGAIIGANPGDDPSVVRHAIEVDFKTNITKSAATVLAKQMLERLQVVGYQGTITLLTDPHEDGSSRFDIKPGDNIEVIGHHGGVTVQVSEVSASGLEVRLTVDSLARDAEIVASMLDRAEEARRDLAGRTGGRDASKLNNARTVPYESESKAGRIARTAVNGNSGLWTIRKAFVSQVGVAKIEFTTSPDAEFVVALLNRPTTANRIASLVPDPLASSDGWYDAVETLEESYGLMEVFGSPENSGGYWPRQEGDGPLTGELRDSASLLYDSPYGGFVWVAMFTSKSCWVEGTVFPAVPT